MTAFLFDIVNVQDAAIINWLYMLRLYYKIRRDFFAHSSDHFFSICISQIQFFIFLLAKFNAYDAVIDVFSPTPIKEFSSS